MDHIMKRKAKDSDIRNRKRKAKDSEFTEDADDQSSTDHAESYASIGNHGQSSEEEHISCDTTVSSYEALSIGDESNNIEIEKKKKKKKRDVNNSEKRSAKKKKVSFQDQVIDESKNNQEDISTSDDENGEDIDDQSNVEFGKEIWGRRFTREENAKLRRAVYDYIKRRGWDEKEGLQKILNCKKYREAHGCWAEISTCLPHRPRRAIRFRAHMMLDPGSLLGRWSKEEEETLRRLYEQHGRKWKEFADLVGRNRMCIKEKWRSLKRKQSTGVWTQGELQRLSDLVHRCYRVKALLGPKILNDRHLLQDDLNWEKIADDIETHGHGACASKWYYHLTSSMVQEGKWANEDDYLLLKGLLESGACGEEEVDWESVLEHRSGQVSMQRWKQMCKYLGENRTKVFLDKLDILVQRYAPELLEKSTDKPVDVTSNDA